MWRTAELIVGIGLIAFGFWFGRKYHYQFLSSEQDVKTQKTRIFITPWLVASFIATAAAFFVPADNRWLMVMGGMGNSFNFLMFMLFLALIPSRREKAILSEPFDRNIPTIVVGSITVLLYVIVFSQGINLV